MLILSFLYSASAWPHLNIFQLRTPAFQRPNPLLNIHFSACEWKSLSCFWLYVTPWTIQFIHSAGQNTGVGSLSLFQGIFPTQGSNPGLPHCRRILYQLSHKGSPFLCLTLNKHNADGSGLSPDKLTRFAVDVSLFLGIKQDLWMASSKVLPSELLLGCRLPESVYTSCK